MLGFGLDWGEQDEKIGHDLRDRKTGKQKSYNAKWLPL